MDIRLFNLQMAVRVAFQDWSAEPDRLSLIKNLRKALDEVQDYTIDQIIGSDPFTAKRGDTATNKNTSDCLCSGCSVQSTVGNETSDEREARTDRETSEKLKEKCRSCSGSRVLYTSVLHPTNPNLDSWITNPCHCTRRY